MAKYQQTIDALNAIVAAYGGTERYQQARDAYNAWAVLLGGTGDYDQNVEALNAISGIVGGRTDSDTVLEALNVIAGELGGSSDHDQVIDALNQIADLPVFGSHIVLSASSIPENASVGTTIGTLSVVGGSGVYTFTITSDPDSKFTITSVSLKVGAALDYETKTSHQVTVQGNNGVDPPISHIFTITVTDVDEGAGVAPVNTVLPVVTGTLNEGDTLTTTNGTWTGDATITYAYQWYRAITAVAGVGPPLDDGTNYLGVAIAGATSATHVLVHADAGEIIFCDVTATNGAGSAVKSSNYVGPIIAASSPIAFIAGVTTASSNGTDVTSATLNSTGANFLVAVVSDYGGGTPGTVTDSKGNTWNARTAYTDGVLRVREFWSVPTSVGSGHTVSYTGTSPSIGFAAFSNVNASPFVSEVGTTGSSTAPAAGSITPAANNSLIINAVSLLFGNGATVDSSFIVIGTPSTTTANSEGLAMSYLIQTSLGAVNPTWTSDTSGNWEATNAVFKN